MTILEIDFRPPLKVYRLHHCGRAHRTYLTFARCVWKNALWVHPTEHSENLPYALVSNCQKPYLSGDQRTVTLFGTRENADKQLEWIDRTGCGGGCYRAHEVIRLKMTP
ncbi:hypothetical protein [Streptomyces sp. NPDC057250]|uniref:hypothetical protein n=1 Tax=Streptomyces sp. NPDC057250 TaxID=3346068 RepID=UPI00363E0B50